MLWNSAKKKREIDIGVGGERTRRWRIRKIKRKEIDQRPHWLSGDAEASPPHPQRIPLEKLMYMDVHWLTANAGHCQIQINGFSSNDYHTNTLLAAVIARFIWKSMKHLLWTMTTVDDATAHTQPSGNETYKQTAAAYHNCPVSQTSVNSGFRTSSLLLLPSPSPPISFSPSPFLFLWRIASKITSLKDSQENRTEILRFLFESWEKERNDPWRIPTITELGTSESYANAKSL